MKGRVIAELWYAAEQDARDTAAALDAELRSRGVVFYSAATAAPSYHDTLWLVRADARFDGRTTADEIVSWVQNRWASGPPSRRPLAGSWVEAHDCPHDNPVVQRCDVDTNLVRAVKS